MKWIKYKVVQDTSGEEVICLIKKIGYNEANLAIAQAEAYNGEYTIEEDDKAFEKEPISIEHGGTNATNKADARKNLGAVSAKTASVSLGNSSWSGSGPYTQTKNVSGVTADNIVIVAPAYARQEQYYLCGIGCSAQADGTLTFSATEKPTVAIGVNVLILN